MEKWIDNSKVSTLESCPREFYLRYVLHLTKTKATTAQAFGTAIHIAIQKAIAETLDPPQALEKALDIWEPTLIEAMQPVLETSHEEDLIDDYRYEPSTGVLALMHLFSPEGALYSMLQWAEKIIGTELQLRCPLPLGWEFLGPADIVIKTTSGDISLVDIKTTGWNLEVWATKAQADIQLHGYSYALQKGHSITPNSCAYLVLQVNRRMLKSGAWSDKPTLKSQIFPTAVTQNHLDRIADRLHHAVLQIEGRKLSNSWPCIWSSCLRFNRLCQFFPLCERFWKDFNPEAILETALSLGYIQNRWHPFEK